MRLVIVFALLLIPSIAKPNTIAGQTVCDSNSDILDSTCAIYITSENCPDGSMVDSKGNCTFSTYSHDEYLALIPDSIEISANNKQKGESGIALPLPFIAVVKNRDGKPIAGVTVNWIISSQKSQTGPYFSGEHLECVCLCALVTGKYYFSATSTDQNGLATSPVLFPVGKAGALNQITASITSGELVTFSANIAGGSFEN